MAVLWPQAEITAPLRAGLVIHEPPEGARRLLVAVEKVFIENGVPRRSAPWVRPLGEGVRKRHWHETVRGKVVRFAVQLEFWFGGAWQPIVRYDASHGFAHRDVYEAPARKRKERINLTLSEALTLADRDIDRSWSRYVDAFKERNNE